MTDEYNEKRRPAYCDRLLYKINHKLDIQCLEYSSIPEIKESDHRPVRGIFSIETDGVPTANALYVNVIIVPSWL